MTPDSLFSWTIAILMACLCAGIILVGLLGIINIIRKDFYDKY